MSEPKIRYDFSLTFPPAPGTGREVRFQGQNVPRELASQAALTFIREQVARQRDRRLPEQSEEQK